MYRPSSRKSSRIGKDVDKRRKQRFKGEYMMVNLHEWELTERAKKQGWEEGEKYGAEQNKIETAKRLISMGLTLEQIVEGTGLPLEKVQELAKM